MLAEIFMLRVETATREAAKDQARFVPIMLLATPTADAKSFANGSGTKGIRNGRVYCIAG